NLAGNLIWIAAQDLTDLYAVFTDQAYTLVGADTVSLQENHDIAQGVLFVPCSFNFFGAFWADALHFTQATGISFDHLQGIHTKLIDNFIGVDFTNTGDEATAEVFAKTVHGSRQTG